jgi:hypothetical protein
MNMHQVISAVLIALVAAKSSFGQAMPQPGEELLGQRFESRAAGIALRPPAGMKAIRGAVGKPEVVRFVDDNRKWVVKVTRVILEIDKPLPLTKWKDDEGIQRPGMLEFTTDQFKTDTPGAEVLRQDVIEIGDYPVGMMAARFNFGLETNLTQQAIIGPSTLQYYIIAMTCPAPRQGDVEADPGVRAAVESFRATLNSLQILDQAEIKEDHNERLYRTRALFVNWTKERLTRSLLPEQWLRVMQDGKDIGYTYVIEELGHDIPRKGKVDSTAGPEGVLIGVRSRMIPASGGQLDSESWLFCSFDRRSEAWSTIAYADDPKQGKSTLGELGITRWREKPVADLPDPDKPAGIGNKPKVALTENYRLEVTRLGRNVVPEPIVRDLPPYYLPQALGQLLPRLVPMREPKTYLFATYVSDAGQLMYRYVDVGKEQEVTLAGKRVRAVPVRDHVGLEGSVTSHYISPEGKYLGSVNEDSRVTILPTDPATLEKLWKNVNLSRPADVDEKK